MITPAELEIRIGEVEAQLIAPSKLSLHRNSDISERLYYIVGCAHKSGSAGLKVCVKDILADLIKAATTPEDETKPVLAEEALEALGRFRERLADIPTIRIESAPGGVNIECDRPFMVMPREVEE